MYYLVRPNENSFSANSLQKLGTVILPLQELVHRVAIEEHINMSVLCGWRSAQAQQKAFDTGHSKAVPGRSLHNRLPAWAIDVAPYPVRWADTIGFAQLADRMANQWAKMCDEWQVEAPKAVPLKLVWGGQWKMQDLSHYEIHQLPEDQYNQTTVGWATYKAITKAAEKVRMAAGGKPPPTEEEEQEAHEAKAHLVDTRHGAHKLPAIR